jgi:hypothetical protein
MTTNRFFLANEATYEAIRQTMDTLWGHPKGGTQTCMPPAADAVRNDDNLIIAPVLRETCEWTEVAAALAQLLDANAITEVDEAAYRACLPTTEFPFTEP